MDYTSLFQPGMVIEDTFSVTEADTAFQIGSGALRVLATPRMISFMEQTAHHLLARHLPAGDTSVGTLINVRHLAPTPVGGSVRIRCEVLEVSGRKIVFDVQAFDAQEQVGAGRHERFIVDEARFLQKVAGKILA